MKIINEYEVYTIYIFLFLKFFIFYKIRSKYFELMSNINGDQRFQPKTDSAEFVVKIFDITFFI